jgi:hypothetical protein
MKLEYLSNYRLLISKQVISQTESYTSQIPLFFNLLRSAESCGAENIVMSIPSLSTPHMEKLNTWFFNYIYPQFNQLGVRRMAIISNEPAAIPALKYTAHPVATELRLFRSVPEAMAWITGISNTLSEERRLLPVNAGEL